MNLQIESCGETSIVRVKEPRLLFPLLSTFSAQISKLIDSGGRSLVINLTDVSYLDGASLGCLMDIYRRLSEQKGTVKLVGLQQRVETMARMVGLTNRIEVFRREESALDSLR